MDSGEALEATLAKMQNFYAQHLALTALQVILTIVIIVVIVVLIIVVVIVLIIVGVVVLSVIVKVMLSDESVNCGVWDTSLDFFAPKKVSLTMMMMMMVMMMMIMMTVTQHIPTMTKSHHGGKMSVMMKVGMCQCQKTTIHPYTMMNYILKYICIR